jgi:hypothetical protein
MRRQTPRLTLDDIDIVPPAGFTFPGPEVANLLHHGGPLALAKRLYDLAEGAEPHLQTALLDLAHELEPGPVLERLAARCEVKVNRQGAPPADLDPGLDGWGPDLAGYIGERWLRRQFDSLESGS